MCNLSLKADRETYLRLAPALEETCVDAVSIEDAHRHNDLEKLLPLFKKKSVIFGVVKIASSEVETVAEIAERIENALQHIDADRLMIAPDCGLALLPENVLQQKLSNMCAAARKFDPTMTT